MIPILRPPEPLADRHRDHAFEKVSRRVNVSCRRASGEPLVDRLLTIRSRDHSKPGPPNNPLGCIAIAPG
jgi:hypothetical protein